MAQSNHRTPREPSETPRRQTAKRKPRRKLGCIGASFYFLFVIGASVIFATLGWIAADDVLALTKPDHTASIVVSERDGVDEVADKLKDADIIKYPLLFRAYAAFSDAEEKIDAGTYELNAMWDYRALVSAMRKTSAARATVQLTFPEGFTQEQILLRMEENGVNTYDALLEVCRKHDFGYDFLEGLPVSDNRLEGFLFPDTYTFYIGESPAAAVDKLLSNFNRRFSSDMRQRMEDMELTVGETVTIASLIEKEAVGGSDSNDRTYISSVIHNRLASDNFPKLQIDATIQYVLPERKERLSYADLEIDSPYNTYLYDGLPPGPIANPGLAALRAALYPEKTDYYYYALTDEGKHQFSKSLAEHNAVIAANPGVYGSRSGD